MISTNRTFTRTLTFWQLLFCIFWHIVSITLFFMTGFTKMSISPAKPLSCWTTKFTFKLYEINTMFWTIFNRNVTTFRTNQLFLIVSLNILSIIHNFSTIFSTSKIRFLTFETHKISIYRHCILFWFIKIRRIFAG
jgi:hypothetical protein